jgi:flagellar hook-basal body complex protein FliE
MINGINPSIGPAGVGATPGASSRPAGPVTGASFADVLKDQIGEVSRMQQDASKAVEDLSTGRTEDVSGVMTAMEKSDMAFKTLLAIRAKLMDAYEEIKGISI